MNDRYISDVWARLWQAPPVDILWGALSSSVVCAILAAVAAAALAIVLRRRTATAPAGNRPREGFALSIVAALVGAFWLADVILRGYVVDMSETVSWWRFAVAPAVAAAALLVVGGFLRARGPRRPVDAVSTARRTWTTFGPRRGLVAFIALSVAAAGCIVILGAMSTTLDIDGAAHIALVAPNTALAPVVFPFPGWAYGLPALAALGGLVAATVFALHRNAIRPYADGVSRERERVHRLGTARGIVAIASAAALIALAGMLRMARAAATTSLTVAEPGRTTTVDVHLPHEDLILIGGLVAPALEIGGCILLVLLVIGARGGVALGGRSPALPSGAAA